MHALTAQTPACSRSTNVRLVPDPIATAEKSILLKSWPLRTGRQLAEFARPVIDRSPPESKHNARTQSRFEVGGVSLILDVRVDFPAVNSERGSMTLKEELAVIDEQIAKLEKPAD